MQWIFKNGSSTLFWIPLLTPLKSQHFYHEKATVGHPFLYIQVLEASSKKHALRM